MILAKICGIKTPSDAASAALAGADALGFHVGLTGGRSPLTATDAAALIASLPEGVSSVVVTSIADTEGLVRLARETGTAVLQLYGDVSPETIIDVKSKVPALEIWKVINVSGDDTVKRTKAYEGSADAIVLDSAPKGSMRGGTGETHDWSISKSVVESITVPVILAGGLNPENVSDAVKAVHPYGVDVNSGVSNPDGTKDLGKVSFFVERAKAIV